MLTKMCIKMGVGGPWGDAKISLYIYISQIDYYYYYCKKNIAFLFFLSFIVNVRENQIRYHKVLIDAKLIPIYI